MRIYYTINILYYNKKNIKKGIKYMSLLKKAMANVLGVGGAKVNAVLSNTSTTPGGNVEGYINICAGQVTQQIKAVSIDVKTRYKKECDDKEFHVDCTIQKFNINVNKEFQPGEEIKIPFSFNLDLNCPITKGHSNIWLSTRLDIENAVDNLDGDKLMVLPNTSITNVLEAVDRLGFRIREVENVYDKYGFSNHKFVQEFEYYPSQNFRSKLDELEVVLVYDSNGMNVFLQIDRRARNLGSSILEKLSLDESNVKIHFTHNELHNVDCIYNEILNTLRKYS